LRRELRPNLKLNYLARRRDTENWLLHAAARALRRQLDRLPAYFFLGDFSHMADPSRPASLQLPVSSLRPDAVTFTPGDSMTVIQHETRKIYTLNEVISLFAAGDAVAEFGLTDRHSFQKRFIEMQLWDRAEYGLSHVTQPFPA